MLGFFTLAAAGDDVRRHEIRMMKNTRADIIMIIINIIIIIMIHTCAGHQTVRSSDEVAAGRVPVYQRLASHAAMSPSVTYRRGIIQ